MPDHPTRRDALAALSALACSPALADGPEDLPKGPIEIIVPATAGGGADVGARLVAELMREASGRTIIVDNKPGAAGAVAAAYVARAPKTGATVGMASDSSILINPIVVPNISYRMEDFDLIGPLYMGVFALAVAKDFPAETARDFVTEVRRRGPTNASMFGVLSSPRLVAEMLAAETDITLTPVPYRGENEAILGILAGVNAVYIGTTPLLIEHHKAGNLKILAISSGERLPILPDVPTFAEQGMTRVVYRWFHGLMLPAGTPKTIVRRYSDLLMPIVKSERFRAGIGPDLIPTAMDPVSFTDFALKGRERVTTLIRERNLKI